MNEPYLLIVVGLFVFVLIFRLLRGMSLGKRLSTKRPSLPPSADEDLNKLVAEATEENGKVREVLRKMSDQASGIDSADLRAAYRCAAGYLALTELKRPSLAVGLYLRALRETPNCPEALDKLQEILTAQKRLRRLEWTYWDVLGRLGEAEAGSEVWLKCWSGLASVYSRSPRTVRRADAIRKAIAAYVPDADDSGIINTQSALRVLDSNGSKPQ